jgi:peptidoglycan hydrolase-like protein with peptidoglycan-binding domain
MVIEKGSINPTSKAAANIDLKTDAEARSSEILAMRGARGSLVDQLQKDLNINRIPTRVDGKYGGETASSVKTFKASQGLVEDGKLDREIQLQLQQKAQELRQKDSTEKAEILKGSKGPEIEDIQRALISRGLSVAAAGPDGDYGSRTEKAISQFRLSSGLSAQGGLTPTVIELLGVKEALNNKALQYFKVLGVETDLKDPHILQENLKAFQNANGLVPSGEVTSETLEKLKQECGSFIEKIDGSPVAIRYGDHGHLVTELQSKLKDLGYDLGRASNGKFDHQTLKAVCQWRRDLGLDSATSVSVGALNQLGINLQDYSQSIVEKVIDFEGFYPTAKLCPGGALTIGHGHTSNVKWGQTVNT